MSNVSEWSPFPKLREAALEWKYVDEFTVRQAAFLWGGYEPIDKYNSLVKDLPPHFGAIQQMLIGNIEAGILHAKKSIDVLRADDDAMINRLDLKKLCELKQIFPEFLYDTGLAILKNDSDTRLSENPSFAPKAGGRPEMYPWDKIVASMILIDGLEGLPDNKMKICARLLEFIRAGYSLNSSTSGEKVPDISVVQKRLGGLIDEYIRLRDQINVEKRL